MNDSEYFAFISYNSRDARWARWLQRRLEYYHLPTAMRRELGRDARIRPVFRYETDMGAAELRRELHEKLSASRFLIVVCSPNSAKPNAAGTHWVDEEIRHFADLGRADRIVPVIVDGVPGAGGDRECFPPSLDPASVAGIDVHREGRDIALQKIVAKLLGLSPTRLIDRWRRDARRRRLLASLLAVSAAALAAVAALRFWDTHRTVTLHFAGCADCFGMPEGVVEVPARDVPRRFATWRFDFRGTYPSGGIHARALPKTLFGDRRKLLRVVRVNAAGVPVEASPLPDEETQWPQGLPPAIRDYSRDDCWDAAGRLVQCRVRLRGGPGFLSGPVVRTVRYENLLGGRTDKTVVTNGLRREFVDDTGVPYCPDAFSAQPGLAAALLRDLPASARARVTSRHILRDPLGRATRVVFADGNGNPATDASGIGGYELADFDAFGRPGSVSWLGPGGAAPAADAYGCHRFAVRYEGAAVAEERFSALDGSPAVGRAGFVSATRKTDAFGKPVAFRVFGPDGKPAFRRPAPADAFLSFRGTTNYRECALEYGGPLPGFLRAKRILTPQGEFSVLYHCTPQGDFDEVSFFAEPEHAPVACGDGYHRVHWDLDPLTGFWLVQRTFAPGNGSPAPDLEGVSEYRFERDSWGHVVRVERRDAGGAPVASLASGVCVETAGFADDRLVRQAFFDADGNPMPPPDAPPGCPPGFSTCQYDDATGNLRFLRWWSAADASERAATPDGLSGMEFRIDDLGRPVEAWFIDAADRHAMSSNPATPWSGMVFSHESVPDETPVFPDFSFPARSTVTVSSLRDAAGRPLPFPGQPQIFGMKNAADSLGRTVFRAGLDAAGNIAELPAVSVFTGQYEDLSPYRSLLHCRWRTPGGAPAANALGIAGMDVQIRSDGDAAVTVKTLLDAHGRPVQTPLGFSETRFSATAEGMSCSFWHGGLPAEPLGVHAVEMPPGPTPALRCFDAGANEIPCPADDFLLRVSPDAAFADGSPLFVSSPLPGQTAPD